MFRLYISSLLLLLISTQVSKAKVQTGKRQSFQKSSKGQYRRKKKPSRKYKKQKNENDLLVPIIAGTISVVIIVGSIAYLLLYSNKGGNDNNDDNYDNNTPFKPIVKIGDWSLDREEEWEDKIGSPSLARAIRFVKKRPKKRWRVNPKAFLLDAPANEELDFDKYKGKDLKSEAEKACKDLAVAAGVAVTELGFDVSLIDEELLTTIKGYVDIIDKKSKDVKPASKRDTFKQNNYLLLIVLTNMIHEHIKYLKAQKKGDHSVKPKFKPSQSLESVLKDFKEGLKNCYGHTNQLLGSAISPYQYGQTMSANIILTLIDRKEMVFNLALSNLLVNKKDKQAPYTSKYQSSYADSGLEVHIKSYLMHLLRDKIVVPGTKHAANDPNGYGSKGEYLQRKGAYKKLEPNEAKAVVLKEFKKLYSVKELIAELTRYYDENDQSEYSRIDKGDFRRWVIKHGVSESDFSKETKGYTKAPSKEFWIAVLYMLNIIK